MGLECQHVVVIAFSALWFSGKEHGLAFAFVAIMSRLGMVATDFFTPVTMEASGKLEYPFAFALIVAFIALAMAVTWLS